MPAVRSVQVIDVIAAATHDDVSYKRNQNYSDRLSTTLTRRPLTEDAPDETTLSTLHFSQVRYCDMMIYLAVNTIFV